MKIYFAGPDVFRENPVEFFEGIKKLCESYGHEALIPDFKDPHEGNIFRQNLMLIGDAECIIANLNPMFSHIVDDGTAMEIGYAFARGLYRGTVPIYGYTHFWEFPMKDRVSIINPEYPIIEDFGLPINLMLAEAIYHSGGTILATLEDVLKLIKINKYETN